MYSNIRVTTQILASDEGRGGGPGAGGAVMVVLFEGVKRLPSSYQTLDRGLGNVIEAAIQRPEISLAQGKVHCLYPPKGKERQQRVYLCGLGEKNKTKAAQALRIAGAKLIGKIDQAQIKSLQLKIAAGLGKTLSAELAGQAIGSGLNIGQFKFDAFKGAGSQKEKRGAMGAKKQSRILTVQIDPPMHLSLRDALCVGRGVHVARSLAATPPNVANPQYLVTYCNRMAKQVGLGCSVLNVKQLTDLKMGGLLAVGQAGSTPPAMICLRWPGTGKAKAKTRAKTRSGKPVLLVGKAVTFDTGGYSLKPAGSMDGMKYDKCGGMAVIGAMFAIAKLKIKQSVVAMIPTAENMVDSKAYRPGDILKMANQVTVEITNTDAEGRLILADALAYGCKKYQPCAAIDMATLTGGVVVALGSFCAGLFCSDAKLRKQLFDAGDVTGERLWHLPLWEEHKTLLKSVHADITNSGGREAHPIQGAAFLSHFVDEKLPWAHLDIAGVSDTKKPGELYDTGPTGYGVRLLVQAMSKWSQDI